MTDFDKKFKRNISDDSIRLIVTPSTTAKEAFLYTQEVGYLEANQFYAEELDNSDSFLLLFTGNGEGMLRYEQKEYSLKIGNIFLIDCKKYHYCCTINPNHPWTLFYLYFNGIQAKQYYQMIIKNRKNVFMVENIKSIMSIFWQIIGLHKKNNKDAEALTSLYITKLLTELLIFNSNSVLHDEYPDIINFIFHYISNHYNEKITLDMLAEKYSTNKFHIAKEFKRFTGTTINEYIITNRINKAKAMLRYTDQSVSEIANEVGIYNTSFFIKLFRDREHVTPLFYRKQWT